MIVILNAYCCRPARLYTSYIRGAPSSTDSDLNHILVHPVVLGKIVDVLPAPFTKVQTIQN